MLLCSMLPSSDDENCVAADGAPETVTSHVFDNTAAAAMGMLVDTRFVFKDDTIQRTNHATTMPFFGARLNLDIRHFDPQGPLSSYES